MKYKLESYNTSSITFSYGLKVVVTRIEFATDEGLKADFTIRGYHDLSEVQNNSFYLEEIFELIRVLSK